MSISKAIVPVAGLGTRLLPTTKALPKEMLPVGRLPVIHHVVEELVAAGIRQILFVTGGNKGAIEDHFDESSELVRRLEAERHDMLATCHLGFRERGIEFFSVRQRILPGQTKPAGTGDAVVAGRAFVGDVPFVVAFGDSIVRTAAGNPLLQRMIASHLDHNSACTIGAYEVADELMHHYGILVPETIGADDTKLIDLLEKPKPDQTSSRLAISARYVFSPAIFDQISQLMPSPSGEFYLTDAIGALISAGSTVRAVRLSRDEKRCDIGNHLAYFETFVDYALDDPEWGAQIRAYMREKSAGGPS